MEAMSDSRAAMMTCDGASTPTGVSTRRSAMWARIKQDRTMLLLALPGALIFIVFSYLPLLGNVIAFQDYLPFIGIADSPFVGFENFAPLRSEERRVGVGWRSRVPR